MERLTYEADFGLEEWEQTLYKVQSDSWGAYNILDIASLKGEKEFDEILKTISLRLKHYEDIGLTPPEITGKMEALRIYKEQGLTPDQIAELKVRDTAKSPREICDEYSYFVCPSCGEGIYASDDFESHKFCLNCGQRLKWEE